MGLAAVVRDAARRFADRAAVVAPEGWPLTYTELDQASDEVAAGLVAGGLRPGDVVGLLLPASPDYLVSYAGVAKAGGITAGVNPRLAAPERAALVDLADPRLVIGTAELLDGSVAGSPAVEVVPASHPGAVLAPLRADTPAPPAPGDGTRPVAIVFTSGTSGRPRGAVFTDRHLDAISRLDVGAARGGPRPGGPMLASTELAHVGAMTKLAWYLELGLTIHLLRRWRAADALRVISSNRISSVGGIAAQIALMLRQPDFDDYDLGAVRTIVAGGGPSPPSLVTEARQRFDAAYSVRYSSTESGGVGTATAFDAGDEEALHTVGRPRPGVELTIRNDEGGTVPAGEVGTVWLRSAAVMAAYWREPAATREVLHDGWLRTGDLGAIDAAGCLRLAGRSSEMYIRGGYNVHPQHTEAALVEHPAVREVAVTPREDPVLGEVGVAVVVADGAPPTLSDLRSFARSRLARHELPDDLVVVGELPRTPLHKLDRRRLAAWLTPHQVEG